MRNIWISSDLHINHNNILGFKDKNGNKVRAFDNIIQMNECILDKHNSVVKPGDIYYCLGDVFFGDKEYFLKIWPKFNGKKRLIVGNHDDIKFLSSGGLFSKIYMWRMFTDMGIVFSHVPLHVDSIMRHENEKTYPLYNVHGHIHSNNSPVGPYRNVCVEAINYTPINIEELCLEAKNMREKFYQEAAIEN